MQQMNREPDADWAKVRPLLDEALEGLAGRDRDILLLRFFQERSLRDISSTLAVSEDAAPMRVARALNKLRELLLARGISTPAEALGLNDGALHRFVQSDGSIVFPSEAQAGKP
jgi:hypothetical protein